MDRKSLIGFGLLIVLFGAYFFINSQNSAEYAEQQKADSLAKLEIMENAQSFSDQNSSIAIESEDVSEDGTSVQHAIKEEIISVSNKDLKLDFSNKGGYPVQANVLNFKTYEQDELILFNGSENQLQFLIPFEGKNLPTSELFFEPEIIPLNNGSTQVKMTAKLSNKHQVILDYIIPEEGYMLNANFRLIGFDQDLGQQQNIPLAWTTEILKTEKDMDSERRNMQVHYKFNAGSHDFERLASKSSKELKKEIRWFGVKSHFFNSTIIADNQFSKASFTASEEYTTTMGREAITKNTTHFEIPASVTSDFSFGFKWYIGPNDYKILKNQGIEDFEEMIQLGFGPFFFVKYISKWMIIPLFDFLNANIASMGLIIILLTLTIRLLLSFFTYKSHLSSAKMRALKPELDALKKKYGDDQQQMGMEQMKLYRTAGVNPLGGCLPMLLQMPFLLSMYYFFPTSIELRQKSFLWAEDLSTFDSILDLGFKIPLYGDHISLFTLLMAASSLFLALYNRNMNPAGAGDNNQMAQMMKYMPYIMPFMFLGWFNNFAAGLTFYYTFSNLISIAQQFVIQKFMINEDKLLLQIQENRSKPASTSKWQQRLEEMQKLQAERTKQK